MSQRPPEELTLIYVFKDGPAARIVASSGRRITSLSLIYSFHLSTRFPFKQYKFPFIILVIVKGARGGVEDLSMRRSKGRNVGYGNGAKSYGNGPTIINRFLEELELILCLKGSPPPTLVGSSGHRIIRLTLTYFVSPGTLVRQCCALYLHNLVREMGTPSLSRFWPASMVAGDYPIGEYVEVGAHLFYWQRRIISQ